MLRGKVNESGTRYAVDNPCYCLYQLYTLSFFGTRIYNWSCRGKANYLDPISVVTNVPNDRFSYPCVLRFKITASLRMIINFVITVKPNRYTNKYKKKHHNLTKTGLYYEATECINLRCTSGSLRNFQLK
jgi:hypothetical protein